MYNFPTFNYPYDNLDIIPVKCDVLSPHDFLQNCTYELLQNPSFSVLHLNIRSCRSNFHTFQTFLQTILFNFTIIILTETWLSDNSDFFFELKCYNSYSLHRNNHGGGIKILLMNAFLLIF